MDIKCPGATLLRKLCALFPRPVEETVYPSTGKRGTVNQEIYITMPQIYVGDDHTAVKLLHDTEAPDKEPVSSIDNELQSEPAGYLYLIRADDGGGIAKIGRWTQSLEKLRFRYRTYYLNPKIMAVEVPLVGLNAVEKVLKDVVTHRDLHADKKGKRELALDSPQLEEAFVAVAAHGDRSRLVYMC